ncbi:MAG TPA: 2-oxoglutarate dehydrogenase E1 component [Xanthomonadaceae bacterium]|nr:2-oxoglutarate dehydrogenase E1 component [Xanthomonadaceae bacterium]
MSSRIEQFRRSSHISGGNARFVEDLYEAWLVDAGSVDPQWRRYFEQTRGPEAGEVAHSAVIERIALAGRYNGHPVARPVDDGLARRQGGVLKLVTAYRSRGHLQADLDPLQMWDKPAAPDLGLAFHGLSDADLGTEFSTGTFGGPDRMPLRSLLEHLRATYCGPIGAEFMHIADAEQRRWVYERMERAGGDYGLDADLKRHVLRRLTAAEGLERYLHTKYIGQKRFSLEGGDSLIPLMDQVVERAGRDGVREIVIGMAHRGRLNLLVNTLGKPAQQMFAEFEGKHESPRDPAHTGDVKYHMGFSSDVITEGGPVHLALGFNPSHLEIIDPVIVGSVRARQTRRGDAERRQVLPILIHGDAAFAAQGVVMELFQMSQARGFAVGGTVHVVINNQIGFTTSRSEDARSTMYCTDVAKMVGAPVLHVNADNPEAVVFCAALAFDFRQQFRKDVVIDLVCYRRHGHNEADEPAVTQPLMYGIIRNHRTPRELYAERLLAEGVIGAGDADRQMDEYRDRLDRGERVIAPAEHVKDEFAVDWTPYIAGELGHEASTAVDAGALEKVARILNEVPDGLKLHDRVERIYRERRKMAQGQTPIDWGFAENCAYGTLVDEGFKLRLVGQDTGRGTFFHRHAVLHGQNTGESVVPLRKLADDPHEVMVIDSLLSEEAVMAFEYGYATAEPTTLVIWEAQFGDFCNGAQVVIDQFISSGEAKWGRLCGLVLMLPHGYEGQGPEHSSARLERFLQLCALDNMQVCVPTTPAQMFHMLRRQMKRDARKPLVVMSPKSMLRNRASYSSLQELSSGGFLRVIPDARDLDANKVERVVVCAGKVYYDLLEEADRSGLREVALVRAEQLYPFPRPELTAELGRLAHAHTVVWCQEEPMNQGAWYQIHHHLQACLQPDQKLHYAGRVRSPSPAVGFHDTHVQEQKRLVEEALSGELSGTVAAE